MIAIGITSNQTTCKRFASAATPAKVAATGMPMADASQVAATAASNCTKTKATARESGMRFVAARAAVTAELRWAPLTDMSDAARAAIIAAFDAAEAGVPKAPAALMTLTLVKMNVATNSPRSTRGESAGPSTRRRGFGGAGGNGWSFEEGDGDEAVDLPSGGSVCVARIIYDRWRRGVRKSNGIAFSGCGCSIEVALGAIGRPRKSWRQLAGDTKSGVGIELVMGGSAEREQLLPFESKALMPWNYSQLEGLVQGAQATFDLNFCSTLERRQLQKKRWCDLPNTMNRMIGWLKARRHGAGL